MLKINVRTGSVSHGTMREEDLIPRFMSVLDDIREEIAAPGPTTQTADETAQRVRAVGAMDSLLGGIEQRMEANGYFESEQAGYDLEELFEQLDYYAPEGHYFGAHEGDGADYGFWACADDTEGSPIRRNDD